MATSTPPTSTVIPISDETIFPLPANHPSPVRFLGRARAIRDATNTGARRLGVLSPWCPLRYRCRGRFDRLRRGTEAAVLGRDLVERPRRLPRLHRSRWLCQIEIEDGQRH